MRRSFAHLPACCVLIFLSSAALAAEMDVSSAIDAVTVYPDGATVTRTISVDLPQGDTTLIARDFPPGLDPASLRVEGETAARVTIGAIDARPPRAERPPTSPELEKRWQALKDERAALDDQIAAEAARKKFAERFASETPFGGEKGGARPMADWRAAFGAIAEEIRSANDAIRTLKLKQRELDQEIARIGQSMQANPPRKMEVRIDLAADCGRRARRSASAIRSRGARWAPLYDARLDTGTRERKPALELVRRAEIVQQTGEDWNDVALSVSTVRTAKGGNGPELRPLIVRYREPALVRGIPPCDAGPHDQPVGRKSRGPRVRLQRRTTARPSSGPARVPARTSRKPRSRPAAIRRSSAFPAA